ncbi:MAG: PD40 domain-containing protein [Bacteroidales bacterium]|nr:PD40 domain-containing protein [Bacteroidales bacterium]
MMKRSIILIVCLCILSACRPQISGNFGSQPDIFPDYRDVTVPVNIAPMNFEMLSDEGLRWRVVIRGVSDSLIIRSDDGLISFRMGQWRRLLQENAGGQLSVEVLEKREDGWYAYLPFIVHISEDEIDPYIAYRLIPPGYSLWREMSIRQRNLETFREKTIYSNTQGKGNCVNCHSFCDRDPDRMLFHMRAELAGTYIFRDGMQEKLDTKTDQTISALVYPYWHPSGKFVTFSVNRTNQLLHTTDPNRIEVFDEASDVTVYDIDNHQILTSDLLSSESSFETFPTFSPDGRSLYFCSSKAVEPMPERYKDVWYSLCRIAFDPETCSFGSKVDTLYNAETRGGSVSFPRISPDGRHLVFTLSGYGNFSIWHKDADLYVADLQVGTVKPMTALNSDDVESYHSWSSDSRWMVFSSRKDDGHYTKPYISYVDAEGNARKPFLLPQKDPKKYYGMLMFSYNIPEFVSDRIDLDGREIVKLTKTEEIKTGYKRK